MMLASATVIGCADASPVFDTPTVRVRDVTVAQMGATSNGRWASVVRDGRITAIHETAGLHGVIVARVYEFDSLATLRRYSERMYDVGDRTPLDADSLGNEALPYDSVTEASRELSERRSVVHFLADVPMLSARRVRNTQLRYSRTELKRLLAHAAALYDSASARP